MQLQWVPLYTCSIACHMQQWYFWSMYSLVCYYEAYTSEVSFHYAIRVMMLVRIIQFIEALTPAYDMTYI